MPRQPRWTALEAERANGRTGERALLQAGFEHIRSSGSHRIYRRGETRVVVPFHAGKTLHPKTVRQVLRSIESEAPDAETGGEADS